MSRKLCEPAILSKTNKELNMSANDLLDILKSLEHNDVVESGEDYEGNSVFSVRIGNRVSTLIIGNQDAADYPEFYEEAY
jgi:hypothetical protein